MSGLRSCTKQGLMNMEGAVLWQFCVLSKVFNAKSIETCFVIIFQTGTNSYRHHHFIIYDAQVCTHLKSNLDV